jgi:pyrimidine-nucleoside phosphorylase
MTCYDLIMKKKSGKELSRREIEYFVTEYTAGRIADYQAASLLMAICLKGMSEEETFYLTDAMAKSGDMADLSPLGDKTVDKHSTGGVGDKTSLIIAPIVAAAGGTVAKMSGRGLGHTGGTVDKLESIPGYLSELSPQDFFSTAASVGVAVIGQSGNIAPADKKLYALRDVTATVDSIPLIASSIMSKKLAGGSKSIVLDVKVGNGAFMKTKEEAKALSSLMVKIGQTAGRRVTAILTDMDCPLGYAIGNILEVKEAIDTLRGNGPRDLTDICITLAGAMISLCLSVDEEEGKRIAKSALASGSALAKFKEWVAAQGADTDFIDCPEKFRRAKTEIPVYSEVTGYIQKMNTEKIGTLAVSLGAGRIQKEDKIDPAAGIVLSRKTGDYVNAGDLLATLYTSRDLCLDTIKNEFQSTLVFSDLPPLHQPMILGKI